jgi:hypothetical protein
LRGAWRGSPPQAFSTSWTGAIAVLREGTYTFATISDDGSAVYIGGRLVVDNRGRHSAISSSGTIRLEPGTHPLLVLYEQDGGDLHFDFLWGRDGASLSTVPPWALWSRNVGGLARLLPGLALAAAYELTRWLAIVLLIALVAVIAWRRMRTWRVPEVPRELKWIVGGSLLLNIAGIWWGLPGHWVAIETLPVYVLYGISQRFSHGWFQAYPPLQYYFLAIASSPILFLQTQGYLTVENPFVAALLIFIYRLVSIAAGVGTVIAAHVCGSQAFSRRAGLFAAAIIALVAPFVHYAKTANVDVPYLFWYGLSLVFYVRMLDSASVRNYVLFGVSAACAICTKDQAYALYLLAPAAMIFDLFRKNREAGVPHPFWRAVIDRRIIATGVALFVTFAACYNLLFNVSGFVGHVRSITDAANAYRVFEPTLGGRWALLRLTVKLIVV